MQRTNQTSLRQTHQNVGRLKISFTEYEKQISLISLPSHRRRDKTFQITPRELSQLRALHEKLRGLGCLPQLLAPLSQLMRQTPQPQVDTIVEVNKLARKAKVWANTPHKIHPHRQTERHKGDALFSSQTQCMCSKKSNMSLVPWQPTQSPKTCGKIVSCS